MTSSSIILSNILASESCELKTTIDCYMDTKLKEFRTKLKELMLDLALMIVVDGEGAQKLIEVENSILA